MWPTPWELGLINTAGKSWLLCQPKKPLRRVFYLSPESTQWPIPSVQTQEVWYVVSWPNTTSAGLAGADLIFQWIGLMEYIPCCTAPALHRGLLPATRLASRIIFIEQNIKKRTRPALCVLVTQTNGFDRGWLPLLTYPVYTEITPYVNHYLCTSGLQ